MVSPLLSPARLGNPNDYEVIVGCPVFDVHDELSPDGKLLRRFDQATLELICQRCNQRERSTGDLAPITFGHTLDGVPENQQPKPVGYARNYRVGTFGPDRKTAILVDFYIKKEHFEESKTYPRRSIELWKHDLIIDPIALLRRTPERDLGVLAYRRNPDIIRYQAEHPDRLIYQMEHPMDVASPPAMAGHEQHLAAHELTPDHYAKIAGEVMKCIKQDKLWQHLSKKYGKEAGVTEEELPVGAGVGQVHYTPPNSGHPEKPHDQYAAAPAANAVFTPAFGEEEKQRMQRESDAIRYAKQEERLKQLEAQNLEIVTRYRKSQREQWVTQLEAEGHELDRAEEVESMMALDDSACEKYMEKVRKRYKKLPMNNSPLDFMTRNGNVGPKKFGKAEQQQAIRMVEKGECKTFQEAVEKLTQAN